jgi:cytochrome bd ubiquinol oxidase subunit I
MDALLLSRMQFGVTIGFHYLFPPMSIGLALAMLTMEGIYLKTKSKLYLQMAQFWTRIFALTFAMGVATGIVMVFGFGTNWSRFSWFVGNVFGAMLGAEGIFAFFLEAGFLGLVLFGWGRISPKLHYFSTWMVALGAHFSAIWILIANSWMQTPAGFAIEGSGPNAYAVITDFWAAFVNPSALDRICHTVLGCWLTGAFMVLSVSAWYLYRRRHPEFGKASLKVGLWMATLGVILQLISADSTARGVAQNQPVKLAAMEGVFETKPYTPISAFGWVDMEKGEVIGPSFPGGLSFLTYHDFETPVPGLNQFPRSDWPNVQAVFQAYHLMIIMWVLMTTLVVLAWIWLKRRRLEKARWLLLGLVVSVLFPQIANQAGWATAELGRQPWVVYGVMRTSEGVTPVLDASQVLLSLSLFIGVYILLFAVFVFLMNEKIQHGPTDVIESVPYRDRIAEIPKGGA